MYPSDVTDAEWSVIEPFLRPKDGRGSSHIHSRRTIINAIFYINKTGCQWEYLPHDFPPWQTVYDHYRKWCRNGTWQKILDALNSLARQKQGRSATPSYGIVDSQSVKTPYDSDDRGIDGGKKVKGRKRHICVNILGNLLHIIVHAANKSDTVEGCRVFQEALERYPSLDAFSADGGYQGTSVDFVREQLGKRLDISKTVKDQPKNSNDGKMTILPKRWIVERTLAWFGGFRRLAKDFEILIETAENMVRIAMIRLTVRKYI
ncbi:MAG: IS5 family transposase [SAR324 cluster bacterium]|nr:IS5 family transposase [SAR324 cluster bacterium]